VQRIQKPATRILLGLAIAVGLLACRTAPILEVVDSPVPAGLSLEDVRGSIESAAGRKGWSLEETGPGSSLGTLRVRSHRATVEIAYSTQSFSITYHDSENLRAGDGMIHRNYNGWVLNFERAIRNELLERARRPAAAAQ
jgi:hypothetical protein